MRTPTEEILRATWDDFRQEVRGMSGKQGVDIRLFTESVFRWLFVRRAIEMFPDAEPQNEWHRIDLLLQLPTQDLNLLIEFKFFAMTRDHQRLDRTSGRPKGGPGDKNFGEVIDCVNKLRALDECKWRKRRGEDGRIDAKELILVFPHEKEWEGKKSYLYWYAPDGGMLNRHLGRDVNRVAILDDFTCLSDSRSLCCHLYRVS